MTLAGSSEPTGLCLLSRVQTPSISSRVNSKKGGRFGPPASKRTQPEMTTGSCWSLAKQTLRLELLQSPQLRDAHPAVLPLPGVEGLLADPELAADVPRLRPGLGLAPPSRCSRPAPPGASPSTAARPLRHRPSRPPLPRCFHHGRLGGFNLEGSRIQGRAVPEPWSSWSTRGAECTYSRRCTRRRWHTSCRRTPHHSPDRRCRPRSGSRARRTSP